MKKADKTYTKDEVMSLMEPLVSTWFNERFSTLSDPQARAIPVIHERNNVLVSSPTGSGKTLTAFMSIINELTRYAREGILEERVYCIYISPLKALANDVNRNLNQPLAEMREVAKAHGMDVPDIRVAVRSGDTSQYDRQRMVKHPPHILITTPESMALILEAPKFKESFKNIEWVILDEIHDICDSKRGAFLSLTLENLQHYCEKKFTRIGLSATMAPIEAIAGYLVGCEDGKERDVTVVESDSKKILDLKVICPTDDMTALSSEIVNSMMYDKLKELIDEHETTLVFTNTRSGAESVVYKLKERGLDNVEVHHSSLGKEIRLDVEERLKRGEIKCVVSSTSLELGIDIGSVDLVCQIGSPKSVAKGLQRIGRSGHSMGKIAKGRLLVFDPDDLVECAVMCRAAHRNNIDRVGIPENCLDVLSQNVVGMSLSSRWNVDEAYNLVRQSYCYRNLPKEKFIGVLKYLGSKDEYEGVYSKIWYDEEENTFGKKKGSRMIYFMNLGTIPEEANYKVITNHGTVAGELSEKFVERLSARDIFVLGGRSFEFVRSKGMTAYVKEAGGRKPTVPSWAGEMLPRSFDLSMDVATFRREMSDSIENKEEGLKEKLCADFDIDEGSATSLISYFSEQKAVSGKIPDDCNLVIEEYIDPSNNQRLIFHFPFGRRVNDALSRGYAYRISNIIGTNVSVTMSDDNFMIGTSRKIQLSKLEGMLSSADLETILKKAIKDSEIFKLRFRHTATRSFMILRNYMGRPISVNRQQTRSSYLLNSLADMDNMPVIEETYREVLEDDMDIKNAIEILKLIESGKMKVTMQEFSGTPSPFAHAVILSGFSDIVLMEDRSALLRELHRKVLTRAMGDNIRDFEFDDDQVVPYFREKIGRVSEKEDIVKLLSKTGPLQAIRERGRNIYAYADDDKKTVDGWVRELVHEGRIGTVFLDEPHFVVSEDIPIYAAATKKEKNLTPEDEKVYSAIGEEPIALSDVVAKLEMDEDVAFRCVRKLESMYLVTRIDITANNKWYFVRYKDGFADRNKSVDEAVMKFLDCFAPATLEEISFALSISESDVKKSLDSLIGNEEVVCGRYLVSENDQYMKKIDHMRLKTGKSNVYDYDTIEKYRFYKCPKFKSIKEYFEYYDSAGSEIDVFNRVENFDLNEWYSMRNNDEILLGRFLKGKVRFVSAETGDKFATLRQDCILPEDEKILDIISDAGSATMRQILPYSGMEKEQLKEAIMRLDKSLRIVRSFNEKEDWGTENDYEVYYPDVPDTDPIKDLTKTIIRAYGPIPPSALRYILGISPEEAIAIGKEVGAETIIVGDARSTMLVMADEIPKISEPIVEDNSVRIYSLFDPDLASKWAEISSRYGDKWIYPLVSNSRVVGALEIWEMSGCIEIRSMDMDAPEMLQDVLTAVDKFMKFHNMKGTELVRIREILGIAADSLEKETVALLEKNGYHFINGFFAKGNFVPKSFSTEKLISYVFRKQHVLPKEKFATVRQAVEARGYIRTDAEILTRVEEKTSLKKKKDENWLVRTALIPNYIGYTTPEFANVYRSAKDGQITEDHKPIFTIIKERQPVSRKEIIQRSPFSEDRTVELMNDLLHMAAVYQDGKSNYCVVPGEKLNKIEALKIIARNHFRDFGIFSAERLAAFIPGKMSVVRSILRSLEEEGFLVKGFFIENDPTVMWMLKEDVDKEIKPLRSEMVFLNSQDNLHVYLRDIVKEDTEGIENLVFKGTKIIGAFKGKLTITGAKMEEFRGSPEAKRFIRDIAKNLGVSLEDKKDEEEKEWDDIEFYEKMNPGAI